MFFDLKSRRLNPLNPLGLRGIWIINSLSATNFEGFPNDFSFQ